MRCEWKWSRDLKQCGCRGLPEKGKCEQRQDVNDEVTI